MVSDILLRIITGECTEAMILTAEILKCEIINILSKLKATQYFCYSKGMVKI